MTPHLTERGRFVLYTAAVLLVVGVLRSFVPLLLAAEAVLALVAATYLVSTRRLNAVERRLLTLTLEPEHGAARRPIARGDGLAVDLHVVNRSDVSMPRLDIAPVAPPGIRFAERRLQVAAVGRSSRVVVGVDAVATRTGRWTVPGFRVGLEDALGMVRLSTYVASATHVEVVPRRSPVAAARIPVRLKQDALAPSGGHRTRRPGHGFELRELREYQPGDSFKHIAWGATGRRRRVMVRESEDEVVFSGVLVIDGSSTMRGGTDGAKFEHTLEVAADLVHTVSLSKDRLGIVSFDDEVYGHLPLGAGAGHYRRLIAHLVALNNVVREGWTESNNADVIRAIVDHVILQDRLDFRRRQARQAEIDEFAPVDEIVDVDLLERWIAARLEQEVGRLEREIETAGIAVRRESVFRRFALGRGIALPYRVESRMGRKSTGLASAVEAAMDMSRDGLLIAILTDLCGLMYVSDVWRTLDLARARRHRVVFLVPFTPDYVDTTSPGAPMRPIVHELLSISERRERDRVIAVLRGRGIPVLPLGPEVGSALLTRRIAALRV